MSKPWSWTTDAALFGTMPLIIDGQLIQSLVSVSEFLQTHDCLKDGAEKLKGSPLEEVSPNGLVYVNQREYATISPTDEFVNIIGTEDATTCHILIIRHSGSGVTSLSHLDGCDMATAISGMVTSVKKLCVGMPEGRLEIHLAGGFLDERKESEKLSLEVLGILQHTQDELHLLTACITDWNDTTRGDTHFPVVYGLGMDVKTGRIFQGTFPDKGPDIHIRSACHFTGYKKALEVYNTKTGHLSVGPFSWDPWPDIQMWISLPNALIRKHLSTSPEQEPPYFEDHVRQSLCVIRDHPHPAESLFPAGQSRCYRKDSGGMWVQAD